MGTLHKDISAFMISHWIFLRMSIVFRQKL